MINLNWNELLYNNDPCFQWDKAPIDYLYKTNIPRHHNQR